MPLSSKSKNLKFDITVLSGDDQGQEHADAVPTDSPVVKKRKLIKVGDKAKAPNSDSPSTTALDKA